MLTIQYVTIKPNDRKIHTGLGVFYGVKLIIKTTTLLVILNSFSLMHAKSNLSSTTQK